MHLSKFVNNGLAAYFNQLYSNPIKTKALTCCVLATSGNLISQYVSGTKSINQDSLLAYALFGLCFGGTIPHYFYILLEKSISKHSSFIILKKLLIERMLYAPLFQAFSLYMIPRLEGKSHNLAIMQLYMLYWPVLQANWKWLTLSQIFNLTFVPPMFRVLVMNFIGFFWVIYLANKRRQHQQKQEKGN